MAELATIARPYAEALFQSSAADLSATAEWLDAIAAVAGNVQLQQFAANPKILPAQVFDLVASVAGITLPPNARNFLGTVIDNGRLAALPEIAAQFRALKNAKSGLSEATVYSAFPVDDAALAGLSTQLEKRFGAKLQLHVELDPELIGGVRVVVGDEVMDTSVRARLQQMKAALTA